MRYFIDDDYDVIMEDSEGDYRLYEMYEAPEWTSYDDPVLMEELL